jgi:hypothetical protein
MKNILTNQFSVKAKMKKIEAASIYFLPCPETLWGQGGWAKHRDSENSKAASRFFCGAKIAPLPLPALFPRAAVP